MNHRSCIWVTGSGGLIGSHFVLCASELLPAACVIGLTRADLDLTDTAAVRARFLNDRPTLLIHCAALSRSEVCEREPALAWKLNVSVTARLAELAADIPFFFFSTDLVFDGKLGNYDEGSTVNPLSVYGQTKAEAERLVLANPGHSVIRTSLNGGPSPSGDRGFDEQLRLAWAAGRTTKLFTDEFRSPIHARATARLVLQISLRNRPGLYHVAGAECLSRWEIGQIVAERSPCPAPRMEPASLKDYQGAPRPPNTSLNCAKMAGVIGVPPPRLEDWLPAIPHGPSNGSH